MRMTKMTMKMKMKMERSKRSKKNKKRDSMKLRKRMMTRNHLIIPVFRYFLKEVEASLHQTVWIHTCIVQKTERYQGLQAVLLVQRHCHGKNISRQDLLRDLYVGWQGDPPSYTSSSATRKRPLKMPQEYPDICSCSRQTSQTRRHRS
jgi:hypothetical protein